jgi:hypothetical protein
MHMSHDLGTVTIFRLLGLGLSQFSTSACFLSGSVELMTLAQKKMLQYVTIRLKWVEIKMALGFGFGKGLGLRLR